MRKGYTAALLFLICGLAGIPQGCGRGNREVEAQVQAPAPPSLRFVAAWGMKGPGPGQLDKPTGIAVDIFGNAFLPDAGANRFIHKFDFKGTPLLSFQDPSLAHPQAVAIDSGGAIYISDPVRGSIFVYLPSGDRYRELRVGSRPNAENLLSVAVGDDGEIYVYDAAAGKVFDYTPRFRLAHSWRLPESSTDVKDNTGAIALGPDGNLFIADPAGNRILSCTREGRKVSEIRASADGVNRKISDEFAASSKYIFVMDADGRTVHVWTIDGKPELDADLGAQLGSAARFPPELAASPRGELLVLDDRQARVLRYQIKF